MMKLNVVTRGLVLTPAMERHVERQVSRALVGFEKQVSWAVVALTQATNGQVTCSVDVGLRPGGRLRFEQVSPNVLDGVDAVIGRASLELGSFIDNLRLVATPPLAAASADLARPELS